MKTCQTCAAWGGSEPSVNPIKNKTYWCHQTAAIATSSETINCSCGADWWCLDHVPIEDEQGVLDRITAEITQTKNKLCNRPEPLTENEQEYLSALNWCLATIEEERNRDHA